MNCAACNFKDKPKPENEPWLWHSEFIILIHGTFFVDGRPVELSLYACPKCGTVKIDNIQLY